MNHKDTKTQRRKQDFFTEGQWEGYVRERRYIEREQLRPVMNDTKWREAIHALTRIPGFVLTFRDCIVRFPSATRDGWMGGLEHMSQRFSAIEWFDINPINFDGKDYTDEITHALRAIHVPFTFEDGAIRIWGYLRPGSTTVLT